MIPRIMKNVTNFPLFPERDVLEVRPEAWEKGCVSNGMPEGIKPTDAHYQKEQLNLCRDGW